MTLRHMLSFDDSVCTGCRMCELICSLRHTGTSNPARARIQLTSDEDLGLCLMSYCHRCKKAPCIEVCPVDALSKDEETGIILLNKETCIGCKECVDVCPFGAMMFDPVEEEPISCDLCGGDPACVKFCAVRALTFAPAGTAKAKAKEDKWYYKKLREALENPVIKASTISALDVPKFLE